MGMMTIIIFLTLGIIIGIYLAKWFEDENDTYKKGQTDAILGIIKYELKENQHGELTWVEKQKKTTLGKERTDPDKQRDNQTREPHNYPPSQNKSKNG